MNSNFTSSPFTLLYLNTASFTPGHQALWQKMVSPLHLDPSLPSTPLLYAFVETSSIHPNITTGTDFTSLIMPGCPGGVRGHGGGGITILHHQSCAVVKIKYLQFNESSSNPSPLSSAAVLFVEVRPRHHSPFLLATVYIPPTTSPIQTYHTNQITSAIDTWSASFPHLPLLIVGDFNAHHTAWHQSTSVTPTSFATRLANWIHAHPYTVFNQPGVPTREQGSTSTIIDLVLGVDPGLVTSLTQRHKGYLSTDHLPFTIALELPTTLPPLRPADDRPRLCWDQHNNPDSWQDALSEYVELALLPLQPALLSLSHPLPPSSSAQAVLDEVYTEFERLFKETCLDVVGTKVRRQGQCHWFSYPGVNATYRSYRRALQAHHCRPSTIDARKAYHTARSNWSKVCAEAKLQSWADLCQSTMDPDSRLRWSQFKRTSPSIFTSLSSIPDAANALPVDHVASLTNLNSTFILNGTPSALIPDRAQYDATVHRVESWGDPSQSSLEPHASDDWTFTADDVKDQCTRQHTNTAPGTDNLLPIFLKFAGPAAWEALAQIYTFSWRHSVTPLAWREANVMALYKGDGDTAKADSYRPISMTSIIARTFEHLIHHHLSSLLDPPLIDSSLSNPYLAHTQFGFRKERRTHDAIHYLLTGVQRAMQLEGGDTKRKLVVPVLFLDIQKAFDRVDHSILLQRVHDAGITGKAWLWIHSFLTGRRMRTVDATEHSEWSAVRFGVPQGCVLSPLLFTIFINDLITTIANDNACRLVSPLLYADDGALAPNPLTIPTGGDDYPARYLECMKAALDHLNRWCDSSRMKFGVKKTQLVLFSTAHNIKHDDYTDLRLCDFTISIAHQYTYLGVILDERLSWTQHRKVAIQKARSASQRINRICIRAPQPHLPSIRSYVLSYLIPVFEYGLLFWGAHIDNTTTSTLQGLIATPLRIAYTLPKTTHQLGVLHLFGLPTVRSLILKAELSHLHRLSHLNLDHPTKAVHLQALRAVTRAPGNVTPHNVLQTVCTIPLALRVTTNTVPRLYDPASTLRPLLPLPIQTLLTTPPTTTLPDPSVPTRYWSQSTAVARRILGRVEYTLPMLRAVIQHSSATLLGQSLVPTIVREITRWSAVYEWRSQHSPDPTALHATASPLTLCKPTPGVAPSLNTESITQARRRARLLMGRSCTGTVRARFQKAGETIDPHCTYPSCASPAVPSTPVPLDSIEHMLLHCPRHTSARQWYARDLATYHQSSLTPSLSTVLLASIPPPPFRKYEYRSLVIQSNSFLDQVEADRTRDGLLPLDTG
jgi:hypothetical protein